MPRRPLLIQREGRLTPEEAKRQSHALEQELWLARYKIVGLAPAEFRDDLGSYYQCRGEKETYGWLERVAQAIVERADVLGEVEETALGPRAICPLCGGSSSSPYVKGFSYPEGLRRHLVGFGRTSQCTITEAADWLARYHWKSEKERPLRMFDGPSAQERKEERRRSETLFCVGPGKSPLLIDERLLHLKPRSQSDDVGGLKWAEQRLFALGFKINVDGREKSYTRRVQSDEGEIIVYADPRAAGDILFHVYPLSSSLRSQFCIGSFKIRDAWKNELEAKVLEGARSVISARRRQT